MFFLGPFPIFFIVNGNLFSQYAVSPMLNCLFDVVSGYEPNLVFTFV